VVILCYHSISTKPFASITPKAFEQHLRWLKAHSTIVPFHIAHGGPDTTGNEPVVALTFDDGYADNFESAFPLLQQYNVPATFFLTAGLLERDPKVMAKFQRLCGARAGDVRPLEWAQVREMRRAGMEFGAHTYSHPNLSRLERTAVETELRRSKAILEERLGEAVRSMAYPFGIPRCHFTRETMEIAAAAGYDYAVAIAFRAVQRFHSRFSIPRFPVSSGGVGTLGRVMSGASDLLGVWQEHAPVVLQRRRWDLYA
jgi:peptidoglycan/xylan/chitin deacetylase (PgdA/CDA1 family)